MPAIRDFATWAPLLAILWGSQQGVDYAGGYVDGQVDYRGGFGWHMSPGLQHMSTAVVRAVAEQTGVDPIALVREALADGGMNNISFVVEFRVGGRPPDRVPGPHDRRHEPARQPLLTEESGAEAQSSRAGRSAGCGAADIRGGLATAWFSRYWRPAPGASARVEHPDTRLTPGASCFTGAPPGFPGFTAPPRALTSRCTSGRPDFSEGCSHGIMVTSSTPESPSFRAGSVLNHEPSLPPGSGQSPRRAGQRTWCRPARQPVKQDAAVGRVALDGPDARVQL